jgi:hypothetical protein
MLYPRDEPRILLLAREELEAAPASSEGWASSIKSDYCLVKEKFIFTSVIRTLFKF